MSEAEERMSAATALDWLQKAVNTQGPEFVYLSGHGGGSCHYRPVAAYGVDDPRSKTGCLIGTAMSLAGKEITHRMEGKRASSLQGEWNLTAQAACILDVAQRVQDTGGTWGEALTMATQYWEREQSNGRA